MIELVICIQAINIYHGYHQFIKQKIPIILCDDMFDFVTKCLPACVYEEFLFNGILNATFKDYSYCNLIISILFGLVHVINYRNTNLYENKLLIAYHVIAATIVRFYLNKFSLFTSTLIHSLCNFTTLFGSMLTYYLRFKKDMVVLMKDYVIKAPNFTTDDCGNKYNKHQKAIYTGKTVIRSLCLYESKVQWRKKLKI